MPIDIMQVVTEVGGLGIAALVIVFQYRFFTNHSKHLTDNVKENTKTLGGLSDNIKENTNATKGLKDWLKNNK